MTIHIYEKRSMELYCEWIFKGKSLNKITPLMSPGFWLFHLIRFTKSPEYLPQPPWMYPVFLFKKLNSEFQNGTVPMYINSCFNTTPGGC